MFIHVLVPVVSNIAILWKDYRTPLLLMYMCKEGELEVNFNFDDQSLEMNATIFRSERAKEGPTFKGKVREFCRQKGHGFIIPDHEKNPIFVHISEYVLL